MYFELITTSLVLAFFIYVFYIPISWMRDLEDVGFYQGKKSAINRARRTRKLGSKIPPPFPNGWYALAESREVKSGCAISVDCLGENFVVFRSNKSGTVFVLDAYCPHMGANLGVGGIVRGDCVECPFHEWKFSGETGECVNIPYSKDGLAGLAEKSKVKKWTTQEVNGLIFLWYHRENDQPWQLPVIKEIESNEWIFHGRNEFFVNSHIQDIPENGPDVSHLNVVHSSSLLTGVDVRYTHSPSLLSIGNHIWDAKWSPGADEDKHIASITLTHYLKLWKMEIMEVIASIKQIGPGYVVLNLRTSFGPMVILQTVTPVEPLVQKLNHYFYSPRYNAWWCKITILGESINVARDIAIWNNKIFVNSPILPKEDKNIKVFRQWFSQFYSDNSKDFAQSYESVEW